MLGYCGRDCENCDAYHADTVDKNHCTGCRSEGENAKICGRDCPIRLCAQRKRQAFCANCVDFPCSKLNSLFQMTPEARDQSFMILGITPA